MSDYNFGGKANSLLILKDNNFNIPNFFVISKDYFVDFLLNNDVLERVNQLFSFKNYQEIQNIISNCKFNDKQQKELLEKIDNLKCDTFSIRSSAQNEDGQKKSYAGQYDTFLNIRKEKIFDYIKKCWMSLYNDSALEYNKSERFDQYSMNIIIQEMIVADYSGVAFSLMPTDRRNNYGCIECCKGLGEKLVSGKVTPTNYIVRRQTKKIDAIQGENILTELEVKSIMENVLKIEKLYKNAMDVEWCLKNNEVYILQARPITAFAPKRELIQNMITRTKKMWQIELYYKGEYLGIKELTNGLYYQNPILNFVSDQKTEVYYNMESLEELPNAIFRTLEENYDEFYKRITKSYEVCEKLKKSIETGIFDFKTMINDIVYVYPFQTLGNIAGRDWIISDRVKKELVYFRENYDYVPYKCETLINNYLDNIIPKELNKYISVLKIDEIENIKIVDLEKIKERMTGFIYYQGEIFIDNFNDFCDKNYFYVESFNADDLQGKVVGYTAYPGFVEAKVKIIFSKEDFDKFEKGNIIVSSMTTPKFMEILNDASGIITDEGGITCHAAIVSRELKKPCLIGCKNATKLFKDGDIVRLDSNKGVATLIK